jgi:cystathionine gamma-synthase
MTVSGRRLLLRTDSGRHVVVPGFEEPEPSECRVPALLLWPQEVHPDRASGFGPIDSFELADGDAADRVCRATRTVRHATSLGGVETTMERRGVHPGQEHIPPGLIRMSTACEDLEDIWDDLARGVGAA